MSVEVSLQGYEWHRTGRRLLQIDHLHLEGPGIVLVVGASGSGKSTLLRALAGVLAPFHGGTAKGTLRHRLHGHDHSLRIGYVPQDPSDAFLAFDPETEVQLRLQAAGWKRAEAVAETGRRLTGLRLEGKERLMLHQLSGGERKRLALAVAQTHSPHLLLVDEPFNHLDDAWRAQLLEDLLAAAESALVVVAAHDLEGWLPLARHVVIVHDGTVEWQGTAAAFERMRLDHPALGRPGPTFVPPPRGFGPAVLVARNLAAFRGRPLFRELDLELPNGLHAITGPNGCGKTTLLRILAGLDRPDEGHVRFGPTDLADLDAAERASFIAYHVEQPADAFFHTRAQEELTFQPRNAGRAGLEADADAARAAAQFRIEFTLDRHPLTLSGGEQERLAFACADAARPRLLVLDEPTHGLDAYGWGLLLEFLARYRDHACILLATHDSRLLAAADTVHRLDDERLATIRHGSTSPIVGVVPRTRS